MGGIFGDFLNKTAQAAPYSFDPMLQGNVASQATKAATEGEGSSGGGFLMVMFIGVVAFAAWQLYLEGVFDKILNPDLKG